MIIWVDAQLPPAIAAWMSQEFAVDARSLASAGMREAPDVEIFKFARHPGNVIMSKDDDFVDMVTRLGTPPQILWVTCGNVTNAALRELLRAAFPAAKALLDGGEPIVELTRAD